MARSARSHRRVTSRQFRPTPYPIPSNNFNVADSGVPKNTSSSLEKKDWEDATCSVCMEYPHNAVLLLCSSHDKGCRPYMCGTSYRHSNCLDQFKKAYTKVVSAHADAVEDSPSAGLTNRTANEKSESVELACPLCRGHVKGCTVVNAARQYLNNKHRSCMQDNCSFTGTYKDLRKHVKSEHPSAKPREVDPELEAKWRTLEHEREHQDVMSTIRSSMPRSVVFGDYVIEMDSDHDTDDEDVARDRNSDGASRGISRSILYFFLREGARLMRMHRDNATFENMNDGIVFPLSTDTADDIAANYSSDGDGALPILGQARGSYVLGSGRRRRRRRRSQGRPVPDIS